MQIPIGQEASFKGLIDIVQNKAYEYEDNGSGKFSVKEVPEEYQEETDLLRDQLAEAVAEADDEILLKYLDGERLNEEDLQTALREALKKNLVIPVLCGSAYKNIGIANMLNFLANTVPPPEEVSDKAALVFKTLADPYVGKMSFFRVYGGKFASETMVL